MSTDRYQIVRELFELDVRFPEGLDTAEPPIGFPAASLAPWQERYKGVPAALVEYYTTLGALPELNATQDQLVVPDDSNLTPYRMSGFDDPEYLVFYVENQDALRWGVHTLEVNHPDPTVHEWDGAAWRPTAETVSRFLIAQAFLQRMYALPLGSEGYWEIDEATHAGLAEIAYDTFRDADLYGGLHFYGAFDIVVTYFQASSAVYFGTDSQWTLQNVLQYFSGEAPDPNAPEPTIEELLS